MEAWEFTTLSYGPSIASAEYQRILKLVFVDHAAYLINYIDAGLLIGREPCGSHGEGDGGVDHAKQVQAEDHS